MLLCKLVALKPVSVNNFVVDENVGNGQQIWAVDPSVISKIGNIKSNGKGHAVFRPVYILQPEPITIPPHQGGGRGHRRFDRGRSFSPPKHYPRSYQEPSIRPDPSPVAGSASAMQFPQASSIPRKFRFNEGFRKSFSSEHLYMAEKPTGQQQEGYFSLSSRSSTTSTGSSTKSGLWQRDIRSGIPIPIQPDSKHRTRHSNNINTTKGPVIARRSVLASPIESPAITRISPRENGHVEPVLPPNSSGSESSGYFTPRLSDSRQAFVKLNTEDHSSESEEPETQNDKNNNNEDCVDSFNNNSEYVVDNNLQINEIISLTSSAEASDVNEDLNDNKIDNLSLKSIVSEKEDLIPLRFSASSDPKEKDFNENASSARSKSKSVVDLQNFLPEIVSRKSSNSAPPLKDDVVSNSSLVITNLDEPPLSASRVDLDETEPPLQLEETETTVVEITTRKLTRRLSRTQSKRSIKSTPRKVQETTPKSSRSTQNKPKETIQQALAQLNNPEWEVMILGLQSLSKIIKTHPDVVESQMHTVCGNLARHIKNLRSQVARAACHTTAELFAHCRKGLDMELEEIAGPLLHRTADTNKFLRADANEALDVMCDHLPLHRIISVITSRGATHQNSVVRSTATRLIRDIVKKIGADKVFQLQKESREKIFLTGANALTDGSPEARSNGKSLFSYLMAHPNFQRTLLEVVPQSTIRHIAKTLNTIKPNSST